MESFLLLSLQVFFKLHLIIMKKTEIIEINKGKLQGYIDKGIQIYRSIPYTEPPVGEFRFNAVKPKESWNGILDATKARSIVQEYMKHRPLTPIEQQHVYDVYKLSILFDCVWYFGRGAANDFREKRKIDALTNLGRQEFFDELFHK